MKKGFLVGMVLIIMLIFSGCSSKSENNLDKATKQKNITKIQNNVGEVMGKSYNYVIENIGEPYITTYYSNKSDFFDLKSINKESIFKNLDIEFIYPKDSEENSALYIYMHKGKVVNVESDELTDFNSKVKNLKNTLTDSNIIVNYYNNREFLTLNKIDLNLIKSYIGKNINGLKKTSLLGNPNAILYNKDKNEFIDYYIIQDKSKKLNKVLSITYKNDKILNIRCISSVIAIKEFINIKK